MRPREINAELDRLMEAANANVDDMIRAGRGDETFSRSSVLSDPLALERVRLAARCAALREEIDARYGPGAPARLPIERGAFAPRIKG